MVQLVELEQEQKRLEYYVSLLQKRQRALIQAIYFDECSLDEVAERLDIASRTARAVKRTALEQLVGSNICLDKKFRR